MIEKPDENACLARYLQGETEALTGLVEQTRRPLFGFILRMTEGRDDAEDIFQEVWVRAIHSLHRYRAGSLLSWLFRIAHNLIIDRYRRKKPEVSLDDGQSGSREYEYRCCAPSPADNAQDGEIRQRIAAAVGALPREQREVFLMRMDAGLPFKEIARIQRTSINTALARMTYALDKLRKELAGDYALLSRG